MKLFSFLSIFLFPILSVLAVDPDSHPESMSIYKGWSFSQEGQSAWLPASVPGTVHTDLMAAGKIKDPFFGLNEKELQWIGKVNWIYKTTFSVPAELMSKQNLMLVFHGLDTYADVTLNGKSILSANNMFRTWKIDVKKLVKAEGNDLQIRFRNVFDENLPKWKSAPFRLMAFPNNDQADTMLALYSRKAQFHYGWDWGPRLVTAGIWKNVELCGWDSFKIETVQVITASLTKELANIQTVTEIRSDIAQNAVLSILMDGKEIQSQPVSLQPGANRLPVDFEVKNPKIWWPNGMGNPDLVTFYFSVKTDKSTDGRTVKTGIRTITVNRDKDKDGHAFTVVVNGIPTFMKGANYIPQDNFQNRVTREHIDYIVKSARDANMNMLRLWAGGIFQVDDFYASCDENGILIWHDLLFACAMYPSDQHFYQNVKAELEDNVRRIRNHPSIALWSGNNENYISWHNWGWKQLFNESDQKKYEQDMMDLYETLLGDVLKAEDPSRYYTKSSPVAGWNNIPNGEGDIHYWGVWHGKEPFEKYEDNLARFVSEYGFQSYPEYSAIKKFTNPEDRHLHSETMLSHQRCMADDRKDREYGNRLIKTYMDDWYREPKNFESYVYVSQLVQAEGVKIAIEAHRRAMPYTMGSLYWQINDCWPVASWSSIDWYGNWKALHYFAREEFKNLLIAPKVNGENVDLKIVSDLLEDQQVTVKRSVLDFSGKVISADSFPLTVKKQAVTSGGSFPVSSLVNGKKENEILILWTMEKEGKELARQIQYLTRPKALGLPVPDVKWSLKSASGGLELTVSTEKLAKNVFFSTELNGVSFGDNFFDLLPGETRIIQVKASQTPEVLKSGLKVMTLTDTF